MATLMIAGGKVGALIGRKRAFAIGSVIYGTGSFIMAIADTTTRISGGRRPARAAASRRSLTHR